MASYRHYRVEFDDGSTPVELPHVSHEVEYELWKADLGTFVTPRGALDGVTLEEGFDEVYVVEGGVDQFGGPLKEVVNDGPQTELIVESPERLARDAEPVPAGERWENTDDATVINDAISNVSGLSAGTVNTVGSGLTFVFGHSSQAQKMRQVEGSTSGELMFHPDGTVDYVDQLGSDKTTTTLSPSNQNVVGDIEVSREGASGRVTHLRLVGAGEGEHQVSTTVVSSSYTAGETKKWDTYRQKSATKESTLTSLGEAKMAELNQVTVEVDLAVKGVGVELGDRFHVKKPEEDLDRNLRVVEQTEIVDSDGRKSSVVLSNKSDSREDPETKRRKDLENYNVAFEGSPVTMTAGGGRQPVDGTLDYEFDFYYPAEVEYEHRVKLFVKGLAYRAYAAGAASGGDHTHSVDVTHPSHGHDITSSEFSHTHSLTDTSVSANLHGHGDGTFGADSHDHSDGTLDAALHGHNAGTFGADLHGHTEGTFGADSHDHSVTIGTTSTANTPHGAVVNSGDNTYAASDTGGSWSEVETIDASTAYELGIVHIHATSSDAVIEVRARDSSDGSTGFDSTPNDTGTALVGTSGSGQSSSVSLLVPEDWGFIDVDYKTNSAPNCNIHVAWMLIGEHTHDVTIDGFSGNTGPAVTGTSDDTGPDVDGTSSDTGPDVAGSSGSSGAGVTGTSADTGPGVSGDSDATGGIRTSTSELGTTQSETSGASGPHTHDPEPGVIETFGTTTHYPSNADVVVNGTAVGVSLGDGTGPFEQQVDLAGMLNPGQVNTVRISSDSLGHIQANLDVDVYRQILGNG